jgi:hypothetical protein
MFRASLMGRKKGMEDNSPSLFSIVQATYRAELIGLLYPIMSSHSALNILHSWNSVVKQPMKQT